MSRMTLDKLVRGRQKTPLRLVLSGVEGVGKSTFAAAAPTPIFIAAEDGTSQLDVVRFPTPETWTDVMEAIQVLTVEKHPYETLVLDTIDWAEPLLWAHICVRDSKSSIEDYGYGKGYVAALDEWRLLLAAFERLRRAAGMNIILVGHSWIRNFKNPEGGDFDRYELKLHPRAAGLVREWSDASLFANYETLAVKDDKTKRVKGVSTGARLLHTVRTAAFDAKNRFNLPDTLPLSWSDFMAAIEKQEPASADELIAAIKQNAALVGGEVEKLAIGHLAKVGRDAVKLAALHDRLLAKLAA